MRKVASVLLAAIFVFALVVPALAQGDTMSDKIVCDSTLMTLLLVAEGDYGYHDMDTSVYDKGELQPAFDSMMSMMDESMGSDTMMGDEMTPEAMMGDEMGSDTMMDDSMMLPHGDVAGEPEECTALRTSVESFLYTALTAKYGMSDQGM